MEQKFIDYYQLLEVHIFASNEAIKAAYKRLSSKYHPDNDGDHDMFLLIQEAYGTLNDRQKRSNYLKLWKNNKLSHKELSRDLSVKTEEDLVFWPLMETVNAFMLYIMNKKHENAYALLSQETVKKIFKKDYVKWQELVGEIHEIIDYETAFDRIEFDSSHGTIVVFAVKVCEYNRLLNRVEEDVFYRKLVHENNQWKIQLHDLNIRQVIKKYKKIVALNKKQIKHKEKAIKNHYVTKLLDVESFIHNLEYEYLRYERYKRSFGMVAIKVKNQPLNAIKDILRIIRINTRITDSFCRMGKNTILILMPETEVSGINIVKYKLVKAFNEENIEEIEIKGLIINPTMKSAKEILNALSVRD